MMVAQQLYEGVAVGKEGSVGFITYMRTDSVRIADVAADDIRSYSIFPVPSTEKMIAILPFPVDFTSIL